MNSKTQITNEIPFADGKDSDFTNQFCRIFPRKGYEVILSDFSLDPAPRNNYKMSLDINIREAGGEWRMFSYTKMTDDAELIDKMTSCTSGFHSRRCIIDMIGNDTFIEELDEFLQELKTPEL